MVKPAVIADGDDSDKLHLLLRGRRGAEPVAGFEVGDELARSAEGYTDHAGNAITKNMPVVPESPNFSNTTAEIMTVNIVMPQAGLFAVVAMALAATVVKKNAKSSVSASPTATTVHET